MKTALFLVLVLVLLAGESVGLVVYRFGGEDLPPAPEVGNEGVEFVQLSWTDLDPSLGGAAIELGIDDTAIRALRRDPSFNITPGIEEKGGSYIRAAFNGQVWDGDTSTVWVADRYLCAEFDEKNYFLACEDDFGTPGTANILLGSFYVIDRIRVVSGLDDPGKTVRSVRVYLAPEMPGVSITHHPRPFLPYFVEVRDNREQFLDIPIPPHEEVGFVQVTIGEHNENWDVNEIEIYAKGFVEQSTFISNIIDFGRPMAWGDLRWSGIQDPQAKVFLQTRSGLDGDPDIHWRFTGRGEEKIPVSEAEYSSLKKGERAGITHDQDNWTFWSAPYNFADSSGAPVVSLSPRRYFQLKVDFLPQDDDGGQIDFLELRASEPVASNLVGEVWPVEAMVGESTRFTYVLRPTIRPDDAGFDRLEIGTSSILSAVEAVRIGDAPVAFTVETQEPHRLVVSFARLESRDSGALVEVDFRAQVLRYGATFDARVSDSVQPLEVPQGVNGGDATGEYEGNRVSVATAARDQELLEVRSESVVFTPNGDGRNDRIGISYGIFEVIGQATVAVEVWDLSGRRVAQIYAGVDGIGEYEREWDGRDESGQLVLPGIYLYRVSVDADREKVEKVGLLHAAY